MSPAGYKISALSGAMVKEFFSRKDAKAQRFSLRLLCFFFAPLRLGVRKPFRVWKNVKNS
jgi:hypothetical protein